MRTIKPLRKRTWVDFVISAAKFTAWLIVGSIFAGMLVLLMISALQSQSAFASVVLPFALLMIAVVLLLVVLNVIQRILIDRHQKSEELLREVTIAAIFKALETDDHAHALELMRPYLRRIDLIDSITSDFPQEDIDRLRHLLIELGAGAYFADGARRSRQKWRQVSNIISLGWLRDPNSIGLLYDAALDPDPDIGLAACRSLSQYNSAPAYEILCDILREGRLPGSRIVALLETSRFLKAADVLREMAADPNPKVRSWIAYLLGRTRRTAVLPVVSAMANDPDPMVRTNAARALGDIGNIAALTTVRKLLYDDNWIVRTRAAKAAGQIGSPKFINDLTSLLHDSKWWPRQNSALALEHIGRASAPALEMLLNDKDRFARNKAAEILGRLGIINEQIAALSGPPQEAEKAAEFLFKVGRAEAVGIIESAIPEADANTQAILAEILGKVRNASSLTVLRSLEKSRAAKVRKAATQAIGRIEEAA